jgi:SAM-dependent methyltransferase
MTQTSTAASHDAVARAQFGPRAAAYVQSPVHAQGEDIDALEATAAAHPGARALDLGCGGGHVAYRLAPHFAEVVASDLSADMLAAVAAAAREKGLANIATAERLPFEDGGFDFVATRFSAHHWGDLDAGLREAHRVARSGAPVMLIDAVSPGRPILDTHLQAIEVLRDPSHVRDYTVAEWTAAAERAGFAIRAVRRHAIRIDFAAWIERMKTPAPMAQAVRALQAAASREVRAHFALEPDGSFRLDVMALEARA